MPCANGIARTLLKWDASFCLDGVPCRVQMIGPRTFCYFKQNPVLKWKPTPSSNGMDGFGRLCQWDSDSLTLFSGTPRDIVNLGITPYFIYIL